MARVVLVTAGAGPGMGQAISRRFAESGDTVVLTSRDKSRAEAAAETVTGTGGNVVGVQLDVADRTACAELVHRVNDDYGRLDVICNHAAEIGSLGSLVDLADTEWDAMVAANLTGPIALCRAALPSMIERGKGAIVNTLSIAAVRGGGAGFAYTVVKHGLVGFTRQIAWNYSVHGIRCNAVCPGMTGDLLGDQTADAMTNVLIPMRESMQSKETYDGITKIWALQPRPGKGSEVANLIHWLASDDAALINGVVVPADAGLCAG